MNPSYLNASATSTVTPTADVASVGETGVDLHPATETKSKRRLKYGTGIKVKRVVLIDGVPVGRGRPTRGTIKNRTYVYIPVDATYDVNVYGTGSTYNAYRGTAPIKTIKKETYLANYPMAVKDVEKTEAVA